MGNSPGDETGHSLNPADPHPAAHVRPKSSAAQRRHVRQKCRFHFVTTFDGLPTARAAPESGIRTATNSQSFTKYAQPHPLF